MTKMSASHNGPIHWGQDPGVMFILKIIALRNINYAVKTFFNHVMYSFVHSHINLFFLNSLRKNILQVTST